VFVDRYIVNAGSDNESGPGGLSGKLQVRLNVWMLHLPRIAVQTEKPIQTNKLKVLQSLGHMSRKPEVGLTASISTSPSHNFSE